MNQPARRVVPLGILIEIDRRQTARRARIRRTRIAVGAVILFGLAIVGFIAATDTSTQQYRSMPWRY